MKLSTFLLKLSATATIVMIGAAAINSSASAEAEKLQPAESSTAFVDNESVAPAAIPGGMYLIVGGVIAGVLLLRPRTIRVSRDEVGIVSKKYGRPLPANRQIAANGEMGEQIDTLAPGRHYLFPFWMYKVKKAKAIQIDTDEIGIVKARDGASLPPGKMFGKMVECSDFQSGRGFIKHGGQRGHQLGILRNGIYRINPKLFTVDISTITHIHEDEIGLVEAKDGKSLPSGTSFGDAVECSNFEDADAFISNGGYRGNQLNVLTTGKYAINTELFKISRVKPVVIAANEVGLVEAKEGQTLSLGQNFGRVVECNDFQDAQAFISNGGQKGKQLAIISPGSYDINTELFKVRKIAVTSIPSAEIGLVLAQDGAVRESGQILSKTVDSNNFQDAEAFIRNGGQKGKQRGILTSGTYRINTDLFTVITSKNAKQHGLKPEQLKVYTVESDKIGIVTTFDGKPLLQGNIAAPIADGQNKFQNAQQFIDVGGYRGLQEEVLEEGSWNLNPWFVKVEQIPLTNIKAGTVGVVISNIGKEVEHSDSEHDRSEFNITPKGYKGIEKIPIEAGKHSINTRVKSIEIVPSHEITLDWTNADKLATNYDSNLKTLMLRSKDGFSFQVAVTQVINISSYDAPKMISRVGSPAVNKFIQAVEKIEAISQFSEDAVKYSSVQNLVSRVLEPMIGNYFRNSAQDYGVLDFLEQRNEIQEEATEHIKAALNAYGVQAVGTYINEVDLPEELEERLKEQKRAGIDADTFTKKREREVKRGDFAEEQKNADLRPQIAEIKGKREIAQKQAEIDEIKSISEIDDQKRKNDEDSRVLQKRYEIEAMRQELEKQLDLTVFQKTLHMLSPELYVKMETDKMWAEAFSKFKFTAPQTLINGGSGNNTEGLNALYSGEFQMELLGMMTNRWSQRQPNSSQPDILPSDNSQPDFLESKNSQPELLNPEGSIDTSFDGIEED